MRLEDNCGVVLIALCCCLADYHITNLVCRVVEAVLLGKGYQKVVYLLLLFRGAGYTCDCIKLLPNELGLKIRNC